jgi:hypothetical protein
MNTSLLRPPGPPGPGTKAPSVPTVQISLPGLLEGRKNLLEALRAQAGERLEHAAVVEILAWLIIGASCVGRAYPV